MLKLKNNFSAHHSTQNLIPVTREEHNGDQAEATLIAAKQLMNSIATTPEQERSPPPSPSDQEQTSLPNIGLAGESENSVEHAEPEHGFCCDLL